MKGKCSVSLGNTVICYKHSLLLTYRKLHRPTENASLQEYQPTGISAYRNSSLQKMPAYRKCQPTETPAYRNISLQKCQSTENISLQKYQPTGMSAYGKCQPTENASLQKCVSLQKNAFAYRTIHLPTEMCQHTEESICLQKFASLQEKTSAYRNGL